MSQLDLFVTLWPSLEHFPQFASDHRLAGIRLNSAMIHAIELDKELPLAAAIHDPVPVWFDIKGRQLRVTEVIHNPDHLEVILNHPIEVNLPQPVLFKAGEDHALLTSITDGGYHLVFAPGAEYGPQFNVNAGESLHIRHASFRAWGEQFVLEEKAKIERVKQAGISKWFLSYVQCQRDVDEFRELIGHQAELFLKIEDLKGLRYVATEFKKESSVSLVAARGDLYVEVNRPHQIVQALRLIAQRDPEACVGSRILLSIITKPVPSCADWCELAWLHDLGYRRMLLCDDLCLKADWLSTAINAFEEFHAMCNPPKISIVPKRSGLALVKKLFH